MDSSGATAFGIDCRQDAAQPGVAHRDVEGTWYRGDQVTDNAILTASEDGVVRPRHSDIGDIGSALGEDLLIGGGDMGVCAEDQTHTAIQVPAHGDFFAGRFGVHVHDDDFDVVGNAAQDVVNRSIRTVRRRFHIESAQEGDDGDFGADLGFVNGERFAGRGRWKVGWPNDVVRCFENRDEVLFAVHVVAEGHEIHAVPLELLVELGRQAGPSGSVLDVADDAVDLVVLDQLGQVLGDYLPTGAAHNVPDAQDVDLHGASF